MTSGQAALGGQGDALRRVLRHAATWVPVSARGRRA